MDSTPSFRPISNDDSEFLLQLRNLPDTYRYFKSAEPVAREVHERWFSKTLVSKTRKIFIMEIHGERVGMGRSDFENEKHLLSWSIHPDHFRKGYGKKLVKFLIENFSPARAEINAGNIASIKIAVGLGFQEVEAKDHYRNFETS